MKNQRPKKSLTGLSFNMLKLRIYIQKVYLILLGNMTLKNFFRVVTYTIFKQKKDILKKKLKTAVALTDDSNFGRVSLVNFTGLSKKEFQTNFLPEQLIVTSECTQVFWRSCKLMEAYEKVCNEMKER